MLDTLRLFLLILEKNGMAAAGREMGLSPAAVSARLTSLEEHFGTRLLHRTTRSLSPTPEGVALAAGARRIVDEVEELDARIRLGADRIAGSIRVSAPLDLGRNWLVPVLDAFLDAHPHVDVDLHLSDGYVDMTGGGFDLALRYGELHDSSLRVRRLTEVHRIVCASPTYLAEHGTPLTPQELTEHDCLRLRFGGHEEMQWSFVIDGEAVRVAVRGSRSCNDGEQARRWAIAGRGIAHKSEADIASDLASGRLVPILTAFRAPPVALQLVYPGGRAPSRRVRALIDSVVAMRPTLVGVSADG